MSELRNPDSEQVIRDCTAKVSANQDDVDALLDRGRALAKTSRYDEALIDFGRVIELCEGNFKAIFNRGWIQKERDNYELAIPDFTKVISLNPPQDVVQKCYHNRGLCHYKSGVADKAIADLSEAIRLDPLDSDAHTTRGLARKQLGQTEAAMVDFNHALRINPASAIAYHNRGNEWVERGKFRRAISDFSRSLKIDPDDACTLTSRGIAWRHRGRYGRALKDYQKALELEPDSAKRRWVLGGFLACCPDDRFRDGNRAVKLMTEACEMTQYANASYLNYLAVSHAANGEIPMAIKVLERSLEIATDWDEREDAKFFGDLYEAGELWLMDKPTFWDRWK